MASFTDVVPTPIAQLSPELPPVPSAVRGIVTVIWPYSSVNDLFAFILAEPDLRLRRPKGQVRVNLYGPSARAVVASGLSSGDQVLASLEGVEWEPAEANRRLSGAGLEWQLKFTNKTQLQVTDGETSETKTVQVDPSLSTETQPGEDALPEDPTPTVPDTKDPTPPPPAPNYFTPAKSGPVRTLVDGEFESPAFVKRARVSYGSLFEDGFDIFDEDGGARGRGRKRARFGRPSGAWRYTSQSPSPEREPEPEVSASEQDDEEMAGPAEATVKPGHEASHPDPPMTESEGLRATSPARPQMTDEACQTTEMDLPTPLVPNTVNAADDRGSAHPPQTPDVPVAAKSQDGSLDQSQQPMDFGTWPDDATMAMPPFTDADKFAQGLNPDLQLGVVGGHFHQPWMSHDNYFDHSHGYSEMPAATVALPPQPGFGSGFASESTSNLAAVRFGFGDSDVRDTSLSPPGNDMNAHGLPHETYPPIGSQDQPFAQANTDYPPLDADGKVVSADVAQPSNANPFAATSLTATALLGRENASIPNQPHPDTQAYLHGAEASVPAWPAAESDLRSAPRFSVENSASADGHTPESALVVDNSDPDGELENGMPNASVVTSLADRGYDPGAVGSQDNLGEAPVEAELEVQQYSADEEPEYDEDDIGDYDTRQYIGPDDDEDDSHDEDLRSHSLEEPFDDGEDEEEEEEEDVDEEEPEDDGEDEYESDEEMGIGSPNPQRPPPFASSAPVVIDLLSSDEEDDKDESLQTPLASKPVSSNVRSVPTRPAPVRTSPEYGPESEEDEEIEDDVPGADDDDGEDEDGDDDDDDDDEQASSDGDDSEVAEDMSQSYRDSSGPEDSAEDSDGAENVRGKALTAAKETTAVTHAKQVVEPDGKATGEQQLSQQATSPDIPAETHVPASEAPDEEMKDVQTETEYSAARSPADKDDEMQDSDPIDAEETRGIFGDRTAKFERANPPLPKEAEASEPSKENTIIQGGEIQVQADSPAPVERVEEDDDMADAPAAPSPPPFTQSFTSPVVDEKREVVVQHASTTGEETETQLPTPMDTQQIEISTSHASIARTAMSTGENGSSDAPAEAGSDAIEVHLKESAVHKEEQVLVSEEPRSRRRTSSTGEQVMETALETSITVTTGPGLETLSGPEEVEAGTGPASSLSPPQASAEDERVVDDYGAASVASQSDYDDPLQALLREEHSKIADEGDDEPLPSRLEASTPSPDTEIVAASSPYGDDAHAQEFQSATSSVHEHAAESPGSGSEAYDTSAEQPEFSDAMEMQEHGEDATSEHGDRPGPSSVPPYDAFSDASTSYTSQPPTKPRASRQKTSTREDTDDEQGGDPSVRLARAAIASRRGTRRRDASPDPTHTSIKTRSSHKSSSPDLVDDSVQIARASLNTPSKLTVKARSTPRSTSPASSKVDEDTNSVKDAKMKLLRHIRDRLPDCTKLGILRQHVSQSIDVMAVALMAPPEPRRAKGGPREYLMSFTVTDYSIGPASVAEVQIYRPHKDSLPKVKAGDVVLLRNFTVASFRAKGYGLQTSEVSSWAVFDKEGEPPQIRGPPVEYGEAESTYAVYLREWFGLLDEKAREKLFKANQKIIDAGKAK